MPNEKIKTMKRGMEYFEGFLEQLRRDIEDEVSHALREKLKIEMDGVDEDSFQRIIMFEIMDKLNVND